MKAVFLFLYLFHHQSAGTSSVGGPALTITPMPSLAACDAVGRQAKEFADKQAPGLWFFVPVPAVYRCIEVAK